MFLKHNLAGIVWASIILVLCSIPGTDIISFSLWDWVNSDKLAHAFVFFVLNVLLIRGFTNQYSINLLFYYPVFMATLIAVAYGGLLELWQGAMFEYRTADIKDFVANTFGSILGVFGYRFLYFKGVV